MQEWTRRMRATKPGPDRARLYLEYVIAQPKDRHIKILDGIISAVETLTDYCNDLQPHERAALNVLDTAIAPYTKLISLQAYAQAALDLLNEA